MRVFQLDDDYARQRKKAWPQALRLSLIFVAFIWLVFLLGFFIPFFDVSRYGIHPRNVNGLYGIFSTVFLHGSFSHIISNTLPLILALTALYGNYPKTANKVLFLSIFITGLLVWAFARTANHIGASGLLYCLLTYIFVSGFFKKDIQSIGISLVIAFLYGSLIFGIIPDEEYISWESHLFGFINGVFLAWLFKHKDKPVYKIWDDED